MAKGDPKHAACLLTPAPPLLPLCVVQYKYSSLVVCSLLPLLLYYFAERFWLHSAR
jgi:hypothetical protein